LSLRARPLTTLTTTFALVVTTLVAVVAFAGPAAAAGTVTVTIEGFGTVTGPGIDCSQTGGPDCSQPYANVQECDDEQPPVCVFAAPDVELTAGPDSNGYLFNGFTGCDTTAGRTCGITVTAATSVVARFRDAQAPSMPVPSPSSGVHRGQITLSAGPTDNGGVTRVEFRVRGALVATDTSAPYMASFNTATVADGAAAIQATAFDAAGNSSSSSSGITIDNTGPSLTVIGPNGQTFGPGTTQSWTITASDPTLATVQCSLAATGGSGSFSACSGGAGSHSVSNQPGGSYGFRVRATDGAGNVTEVLRTFSIDATAPQATFTKQPPRRVKTRKKKAKVTYAFAAEPGATFRCSLDGAAFAACPATVTYKVKPGKHTFQVVAVDAAGNVQAAPTTSTFKVKRVKRR
jgi:hypothetical protein